MKRSRREQALYLLSLLFAAAPFGFGLLRAFTTGTDFRMLWMALASSAGAAVVMAIGKARPYGLRALSVLTLFVSTLLAGTTAYMLGARAAFGIWAVAFVFGFCWTARYALSERARSPA